MKWKTLLISIAAMSALVLFTLTLSHSIEDCITGSPCGPYNFGAGIADMAYDHTRGLFYQLEVGSPGGIFAWNAVTCSLEYGPCSPVPWSLPQRGIAHRPDEDVLYVGGWDEGIIYKISPPPNCQLLDTFNMNWHPYLANISGLAWDDDYGGLFVASKTVPDYFGKIDFENKELIWDSPMFWCNDTTSDTSCVGLSYSAGYLVSVNTSEKSVEFFLNPEFDAFEADTCCYLPPEWLVGGVGLSEGLVPWVSDQPSYLDYPLTPLVDSVPRVIAMIVLPDDSASVYDTVRIILVDERGEIETITQALFEYSPNGTDWYYVGDDFDGTDEVASSVGPDTTFGDGWSGYWSTNSLSEGWYYLRGSFYTESGLPSSDTISVHVDPAPPIPKIDQPDFEAPVGDSIEIHFMLRDSTEIDSVLVEIAKAEKEYDKGVPKLRQLDYDPCGSTKCGPTAVASCLKYWGANGFPKLLKSPDGKRVLSDKEMVEELARKMNWKHCCGTKKSNLVKGTKKYIKQRKCLKSFKFKEYARWNKPPNPPKFKDYKLELEKKREDVILLIRRDAANQGHYVTGNSLKNKKNKDGTWDIDFMDPWRGDGTCYYKSKWDDDGIESEVDYGFGAAQNRWKVRNLFSISPKKLPAHLKIPKIGKSRLLPPIKKEYRLKFSSKDMKPGEIWFLHVQVHKGKRTYEDYTTVVKHPFEWKLFVIDSLLREQLELKRAYFDSLERKLDWLLCYPPEGLPPEMDSLFTCASENFDSVKWVHEYSTLPESLKLEEKTKLIVLGLICELLLKKRGFEELERKIDLLRGRPFEGLPPAIIAAFDSADVYYDSVEIVHEDPLLPESQKLEKKLVHTGKGLLHQLKGKIDCFEELEIKLDSLLGVPYPGMPPEMEACYDSAFEAFDAVRIVHDDTVLCEVQKIEKKLDFILRGIKFERRIKEKGFAELERKLDRLVERMRIKLEIGQIDTVSPGALVTVPIMVKNLMPIGGFNLTVEFDYTNLTFVGAERGSVLAVTDESGEYKWEYFSYRVGPCQMCPCCKHKIYLLGLRDIPNSHYGQPLLPHDRQVELIKLRFVVASDYNLAGLKIPLIFEWDDYTCTENTVSDSTGDTLFVSSDTVQFNLAECPSDPPVPAITFIDGGIEICAADTLATCKRGDVNFNQVTYEVADAVLFASYFVEGLPVFRYDQTYQICATDANADGRALTLSDLVYLIRVILHDAVAIPKLTPSEEVVSVISSVTESGVTVTTASQVPIGAALFMFDHKGAAGRPEPLVEGIEMLSQDQDGQLRVLLWNRTGKSIPSGEIDLFAFDAKGEVELTMVELVDKDGRELRASISTEGVQIRPKDFALLPNYPNPFNIQTQIRFDLPTDCRVSLRIYNINGQLVKTLADQHLEAGRYTLTWDGTNQSGSVVASGVYFYKLTAGRFSATEKMLMMK